MIARINESKTLAKHLSCECNYKYDGRKCNSNQKWNNDKRWLSVNIQKTQCGQKCYIWNPSTCNCVNGKYLESIIDDSVITWDEFI